MLSTPLTCCSIGVATVSATTLALAPGYVAVTCSVGGVTSGYCAIGSCVSATPPTMMKTIDRTLAKIGRSMKKWEITAMSSSNDLSKRNRCLRRGLRGRLHRFDGIVKPSHLQAVHDDPVLRRKRRRIWRGND